MKGYHFGKLLEKCSIISEYTHKVIVYQVIKGIIRDKIRLTVKVDILLSAYYQHLLSGDIILIFTYLNTILTV